MNTQESQPEHLGPYRIERLLGRGGMGTVYAGTHVKTGERVALKVIADSIANQERFRRRFDAEVETLKRLSHNHIVRLVGYGEEEGRLFYSMEFVDGESLQQRLKSQGKLEWQITLQFALQVTSALKHAHDFGIIHRDLKPANLLLDADDVLKVTDFGIAKIYGGTDETVMGAVLGTADYMPPEQAEGLRVTAKSDLYALGAVMFTCLTGQSPHAAATVPEALYNARYKQPPPMSQLGVNIPPPLDELTMELLRKDPAERPATAFVVLNRLSTIQSDFRNHSRGAQPNHTAEDIRAADTATANAEASWAADQTADLPPGGSEAPSASGRRAPAEITLASEALMAASHRERSANRAAGQGARASGQGTLNSSIAESEAASARQPRRSHFVTVEEDSSPRRSEPGDHSETRKRIISIAGLSLLLIVCVGGIWYSLQPPTADQLFTEASLSLADDDPETAVEAYERFEAAFPDDPRVAELAASAEELRAVQVMQELRSARRGSRHADPLELALAAALQSAEPDPDLAVARLRDVLQVFADDRLLSERQLRLRTVAAEELEKLEKAAVNGDSNADAFLREQFDAATRLDPLRRIRFYRSVIELFSDVPAARKAVRKAQALLQSLEAVTGG